MYNTFTIFAQTERFFIKDCKISDVEKITSLDDEPECRSIDPSPNFSNSSHGEDFGKDHSNNEIVSGKKLTNGTFVEQLKLFFFICYKLF